MAGQPEVSSASGAPASRRRPRRVFMSYAHENKRHKANVLLLAKIIRAQGFEVFLDRWKKVPRRDWNLAVTNEIRSADFVLAIVSSSYKAAAEGASPPGANLGVQHELAMIRELINGNREEWIPRIIPVVLPGWSLDDVPLVLQPTTATRCHVDTVTEQGAEDLLELLTADPDSPRDRLDRLPRRRPWRARVNVPWTVAASVLVAAGSVLSVAVACDQDPAGSDNDNSVSVSGTGNSVNQNSGACGQVSDNSTCIVQLEQSVDQASEAASTDAEFKAELAKDATADPSALGSGPWPFVVVDTFIQGQDWGLFARTSNQVHAEKLGTAANRSMIWADCIAESDFTPADVTGDNNVGPQWLRVRWTPASSPTARSVSEPTETQRAWMYRGATVPLKHNGNIPTCS